MKRGFIAVFLWYVVVPLASASTVNAPWLPEARLDDFDCRRQKPGMLLDWSSFRTKLQELTKNMLDPTTVQPLPRAEEALQTKLPLLTELAGMALSALLRFYEAVLECPLGAVTASIFLSCLAHEESPFWSAPPFLGPALGELREQPLIELIAKDLQLALGIAPAHTLVATEWPVFQLLTFHLERKSFASEASTGDGSSCAGTDVAGWSSESVRSLLHAHMPFASGRDIRGIKFLRGLDPLVSKVMGDPADFSLVYMQACPAGAASIAAAATMLSLMTNPVLFYKFANLLTHVLATKTIEVVAATASWRLFHSLSKLRSFATRGYDLEWSAEELLAVPEDATIFDQSRTDAQSRQRRLIDASQHHSHEPTRKLAAFLRTVQPRSQSKNLLVYLTAAGGHPFNNYIDAFVGRAKHVGLPALVLACMDEDAEQRCKTAARRHLVDGKPMLYCSPSFEGHVVLVKHRLLPTLLSASVDTVWVDFDTFLVRDPTEALMATQASPSQILPERQRVRFGSFLFSNSSDICGLTKICDPRMHWNVTIKDSSNTGSIDFVEMLVTEHWDARCLNNGLFYVAATHRTLIFFTYFLLQLYINPYADNQNLLDAFLAHSTVDETVPESRPLLNYALLDIEKQFACAEGHGATVDEMVTFHFWSSDFQTREVGRPGAAGATQSGSILTRSGVERVAKSRASKATLFDLFYGDAAMASGSLLPEAHGFLDSVRVPPPPWKGMCSVTAVGVEDLVDERFLQRNQSLIDWAAAAGPPQVSSDKQPVATQAEPSAMADREVSPSCSGLPWQQWVDALRHIAILEDAHLLSAADAAGLKALVRNQDVRPLLTIEAFLSFGNERLAAELKQMF